VRDLVSKARLTLGDLPGSMLYDLDLSAEFPIPRAEASQPALQAPSDIRAGGFSLLSEIRADCER
jgi:hypothetical protein